MNRLAIFTICANNYMPAARVLLASARTHHPEADLYLCLSDRLLDMPDFYDPDWTVIAADQLAIVNFSEFSFRYDIMEFSTAVKPFMFQHLLNERRYDAVLYFDPDIEIFQPLHGVLTALSSGASFVLTPHLLVPSESIDEPNDFTIMRAGAYNLGFLAVGRGEESNRVLAWWARRVRYHCVNAQELGIFVDQKFLDLVPGFAPSAEVSHDPTLNVAYWNLSQRSFSGSDSGWRIGTTPLTFFHFSGFDPRFPSRLTKHHNDNDKSITEPLGRFLADYARKLVLSGYGTIPNGIYAYGRFASGTAIHPLVRVMFREWHETWPDDPFITYEAFLHEPWPGASRELPSHMVTNFQKFLYDRLPHLHARLDLGNPAHVRELVDWYAVDAAKEWRLDLRLIEPTAANIGCHRVRRRSPPRMRGRGATRKDVTVVGYLRAASGVGEVGRQTLLTLASSQLAVEGVDVALGVAAISDDVSVAGSLVKAGTAPVQIFNINADQIPVVLSHLHRVLRPDAVRIHIPFWELSRVPNAWMPAFAEMDEIWAPSRFILTALAPRLIQPVIWMPIAIELTAPPPLPRARFGLPEDRFLFFFAFDFLSFKERKNPRAAIAAFRQAFPRRGEAGLVLKCQNGAMVPDQLAAFESEIGDNPDVFTINQTLSRGDTLGLIAATDAVVSLHRSEGLGLLIAEAMLLGKPVIATDYSGSQEFLNESTGYPVDCNLIPVAEGDYPFATDQEWADPDIAHAAWHMRRLVGNPDHAEAKISQAMAHLRRNYSRASVAALQARRLRSLLTR